MKPLLSMAFAALMRPGHRHHCCCRLQDDQLLIAIVTEFNQNWHLVADVLRSASTMSGIHRKWDSCKHRYGLLQKHYATMVGEGCCEGQ